MSLSPGTPQAELTRAATALLNWGSSTLRAHDWRWFAAGLYVVCGLLLLPHYQHTLYPDTVSYISIARKYLAGDFAHAVNSYWAPLISWAMVPFLGVGFTPLQAIKLISIVAGAGTILAADHLFAGFSVAPAIRRVMLLALVPAVLYFSMSMPTPDLLLTASLTAYFGIIFRDDYATTRTGGLWCGAFGGLAYLSKHYALPFFIVHFIALNAWHYRRGLPKRRVVLNTSAGLLACAFVALPWVAAISLDYGQLTVGTSGARTHAYVGPQSRGDTLGPHGLVAPPNATAASAWEDPTVDMLEPWSPFESKENRRHQAGLLLQHARQAGAALQSFSPLALLIVFGYAVFVVRARAPKGGALLFTMVLYLGGYLWVFVEIRYLWPLCVLLLVMAGVLLTPWTGSSPYDRRLRQAAVAICAGSFVVPPVLNLTRDFGSGKELYRLANVLRHEYGVGGNIAAHSRYRTPLYLTYYLDGRFFGTSDLGLPEARIEEVLLENDIDFYFVSTDTKLLPGFLRRYRDITAGELPGLRVYRMKAGS